MRTKAILTAIFGLWFAGLIHAQSLADVARQDRARQAEAASQNQKVYTNETIPQAEISGPEDDQAGTEKSKQTADAKPATSDQTKSADQPDKSQADLEKEYRDKFAKLRDDLDLEQRKLDVMQRELNLMQVQYYSNPQTEMEQETFRTDINKRTEDIETQKAVVAKAQQAISDLQDELRTKGLPPGWGREPEQQQQSEQQLP